MSRLVSILIVALMSFSAVAQQAAPGAAKTTALPADAATREQILKLFGLLQVRKTMTMMIEASKTQARSLAEDSLRQVIPNATAEDRKEMEETVNGIMDDTMKAMPIEEMLDVLVPVYQRHFTKTDVDAITLFYSSPTGQKFLREQPQMIQESMQAMAPLQRRIMNTVLKSTRERTEKLIEAQKARQEQAADKDKKK
ncbi:MAG TPA: DUF2059 domain-containing protein [Alphaproteobacteria bacterium]|nr:DUF2059 domain-containing protein [Alphaproteobacteria bacterium]